MKKIFLILFGLFTFVCLDTFSAEINVVDVRRNIPLADEDPVYKDFYINAGEGSGLKKNLVVTVKRKINLKDAAAKSIGDFETQIGQLKIIHAENKIAVAREYKLFSRDDHPMLEQTAIMTGDRIDLNGAFTDNSKPVKKKVAAAPTTSEDETSSKASVAASNSTSSSNLPATASAQASQTTKPVLSVANVPATGVDRLPAEKSETDKKVFVPAPLIEVKTTKTPPEI